MSCDDGEWHSGAINLVYRSGLGFPAEGGAPSHRSPGKFPPALFFKEQADGVCQSPYQFPFRCRWHLDAALGGDGVSESTVVRADDWKAIGKRLHNDSGGEIVDARNHKRVRRLHTPEYGLASHLAQPFAAVADSLDPCKPSPTG